jgi:hypothetical protein
MIKYHSEDPDSIGGRENLSGLKLTKRYAARSCGNYVKIFRLAWLLIIAGREVGLSRDGIMIKIF